MAEDKEKTVDGKELAEQDPAVVANEPQEPEKSENEGKTAQEVHGERLPDEVKSSGIGVSYVSGVDSRNVPMGVRGEQEDEKGEGLVVNK